MEPAASSTAAYLEPEAVRSVAVIGMGSVGASWSALFLAHGLRVVAYDPGPGAAERAKAMIVEAWPALRALHLAQEGVTPLHALRFVDTLAEAARSADVVQENVPEKPWVKTAVMVELGLVTDPSTIILSSTGGMPPSMLQRHCAHPERVVVLHPLNPSHLIPLVEVVGGAITAPLVVTWAMTFARLVGKRPIRLNREATGHLTNRLQFALMREAVHCLVEGVASASDIDAAVSWGLAPRWALMGSLLTLHLAGGDGGMKGILDHAGDAIESWWSPSGSTRLDAATRDRLIDAATEVAAGGSVADWVRWRDQNLVHVIRQQRDSVRDSPSERAAP